MLNETSWPDDLGEALRRLREEAEESKRRLP